jgi:hypothetical protein
VKNARKIIADHYDPYLGKTHRGLRGICKHSELEPHKNRRAPFYPHGAIDAKVVDSRMAKQMSFWAKFGASCNRVFRVEEYLESHPEYEEWREYLVDFPNEAWSSVRCPSRP